MGLAPVIVDEIFAFIGLLARDRRLRSCSSSSPSPGRWSWPITSTS